VQLGRHLDRVATLAHESERRLSHPLAGVGRERLQRRQAAGRNSRCQLPALDQQQIGEMILDDEQLTRG
jgi:hypothetical protein